MSRPHHTPPAGPGPTHPTRPLGGQAGSITVWFALLAGCLFALAGLVAAGGDALAAKAQAGSQAFAAARAGAQALSASSLAAGTPILDPAGAQAAADRSLAAAGAHGSVQVTGLTVAVTVRKSVDGGLLAVVGIGSISVTDSAAATATPGP